VTTSSWLKGFFAFTKERQIRNDPYASRFLKTNLMHPGTKKKKDVSQKGTKSQKIAYMMVHIMRNNRFL